MRRTWTSQIAGFSPPTSLTSKSLLRSISSRPSHTSPSASHHQTNLAFVQPGPAPDPVSVSGSGSLTTRQTKPSSPIQFSMSLAQVSGSGSSEGSIGAQTSAGVGLGSDRTGGAILTQQEMDELVDGIEFNVNSSFDLSPANSPTRSVKSPSRLGSPLLRASSPLAPPSRNPYRQADGPSTASSKLKNTPTKRKSAIIDFITLSPSPTSAQARAYSSSAREPYEADEPLPAPPPEDKAYFDRLSALIERGATNHNNHEDVIELSDDSLELSPIRFPGEGKCKENVKPAAKPPRQPAFEAELSTRTFTPNTVAVDRPVGWLAELSALQMAGSSSGKRQTSASKSVPRLIQAARREASGGLDGASRTMGRAKSTWAEKNAKEREKQLQLALANPQFKHEDCPLKPRMVYSVNEQQIARELSHMSGPLGFE